MKDFTRSVYQDLLTALLNAGYLFLTLENYIETDAFGKAVILRHDIDLLPENALAVAGIEHDLGIRASFYFRIMKQSFDEAIIRQIAEMGHEIGYHYEDLTLCRGDDEAAIRHFEDQLARLRKIYPVKTICMHGSPLSRWDNRDLWKKYDYRDFGIIAEPYFDVDFSAMLYLTDTGRRWDGECVSVRDKVSSANRLQTNLKLRSTMDIIRAAGAGRLPDRLMITTHPQRWDDRLWPWVKELVWQNVKNTAKRWFFVR